MQTAYRPRPLSARERRNIRQTRCGVASIILSALAFALIVGAAHGADVRASATVIAACGCGAAIAFVASWVALIVGSER